MAPAAEPPSSITLRVKVPPGTIPGGADEFTLGSDVQTAWKLRQIRERIQETIPSSPTPERQRLLYGGRALVDDDQTVADALNIRRDPTQTEYVIHLLVKGDGANTMPVPHRTATPGRSGSPASAAPAPQPQQVHGQVPLQQQQQQLQELQQRQQIYQNQQAAIMAQAHRQHVNALQQAQMHQNQMVAFPGQQFAGHVPMQLPPAQQFQHPQQLHHMHQMQLPHQPHPHQTHPHQPHQAHQPTQAHAGGQQNPAEATANTPEQQLPVQGQEGQTSVQRNDGTTTFHLPPRVSLQQTSQGQDVQVRISQSVRIPNAALQAQQRQLGLPALPQQPQAAGRPLQANQLSALDRARANLAESQRVLERLRDSEGLTEEQLSQLQSVQDQVRSLVDYVDPFHVGTTGNTRPRAHSSAANIPIPPIARAPPTYPLHQPNPQRLSPSPIHMPQQSSSISSTDVSCYLLSSPNGPSAILYSPQHGMYTSNMPPSRIANGTTPLQPTPTTNHEAANAAADNAPAQAVAQRQGQDAQQPLAQAQAPAAEPDPLGPFGPILGHMWLLLRVLIFAYFLLGANMGWRRPLCLLAIGVGFWMIRMGLFEAFGPGGALRNWWDGIVNDGRPPAAQQGQNQQQEGQQQQLGRPGEMPTPEQLAQRLLNEDARARNQARDQRLQWLRERIRPVERAVALLVASLWPGVGEAYVRAREQEERRRAEEEIAARRREEEERVKREEEQAEQEKNENGAAAAGEEKATEAGVTPTVASTEASAAAAGGVPESEKTATSTS